MRSESSILLGHCFSDVREISTDDISFISDTGNLSLLYCVPVFNVKDFCSHFNYFFSSHFKLYLLFYFAVFLGRSTAYGFYIFLLSIICT